MTRNYIFIFLMWFGVRNVHGSLGEPWWLWEEDPINEHIYHSEYFLLHKKQGEDRGPVPEVIVSRTNFISSHTSKQVQIMGLSNARDLVDWLGIGQVGLFNFLSSVRPVPLEVHIQGFPGQHYCPHMASMNKPVFQAIRTHSPAKPVLISVSSRRQTRLTALVLNAFLAAEDDLKQWLHQDEREVRSHPQQ
ncbi:hypothetical protein cypCar_00023458 [Cyprinus carpio]|nr:hypothetical protein cypCar_00023458 [Cyprinus carpio]